ncbi:lipid IV(A) 3-deoxy-D-manno-octulosonic acid transferase [Vibrio sonorensis]|uniref:lipid IV(A) 3-deoxy-D-manno-octulosonic acid transferase n=1 Tax=Vibrio sonorensis TaxID=1004316 RepID=UPI0008DA6909|nr:lipid IV(A) 3-deoxy-D-manno-octulosonic acid transferase [Vibrio sonorensis]
MINRFAQFVYTLLIILLVPIGLFVLLRKRKGRPSVGCRWKEYLGVFPALPSLHNPIWIHAVSVGEVLAAKSLTQELQRKYPNQTLVITTTTPTGAEQAKKLSGDIVHLYMPLDIPWAINKLIRTVKPCKLIVMETELWPNTIVQVHKSGIPIYIVNARLSEKSLKNYQKIQPLFEVMRPCLTKVLCQYDDDANRFKTLGLSTDQVKVTGSIKFDIKVKPEIYTAIETLKQQVTHYSWVWVAASTHQGEDEVILEAHRKLLDKYPSALLMIVPRHPERFDDVYELATQLGLTISKRTETSSHKITTQVYLGDTMGEMMALIGAGDLCFMGGSLIGKKVGGHNFLEPASLKKPMLSGKSYFNFQVIGDQLIHHGALRLAEDSNNIADQLMQLCANSELVLDMGEKAHRVFKNNSGSLAKTLHYL